LSFALPEALFFTGIDWAAETHAVCVMSAAGKIAAEFTIEHSADGIATLTRRLAKYGDPGEVPVAIERPDGRLVDLLLEAGHPVVPVKPNAIKTWRDGEVLSGAKSDAGDAAVIAEYLRLRAHKLKAAAPYSGQTKALRTVVRARGDLVEMRVAATNQLSALLDAHWPGAKAIFADVESPVSLEFLTRYPTPAAAAHLGEKRMAAFCVKHGYCGRRTAAELLTRLRSAPAGATGEALTEALRDAVLAAVSVLTALNASVKALDRSAAAHLGEHPDSVIFTSLPRSGQVNAAQVLAEWGDARQAYEHPDSVAALAGSHLSPGNPENTGPCTSAGPATSGSASRSPPSPTTAATPAPGPRRSTTTPAPAAKTTPTPCASSPAHGSASYGAAGSTASPTTPPCTEPQPRSPSRQPSKSRPEVDTGSVMRGRPLPAIAA